MPTKALHRTLLLQAMLAGVRWTSVEKLDGGNGRG